MKLVEGRASYLPVRLLVQITNCDGIDKQLVEALRHFKPHGFFQFEWKYVTDRAVLLNFGSGLVKPGLCADDGMVVRAERFCHKRFSPPLEISIWRARLPCRDRLEETAASPGNTEFQRTEVSAFRRRRTSMDTEAAPSL